MNNLYSKLEELYNISKKYYFCNKTYTDIQTGKLCRKTFNKYQRHLLQAERFLYTNHHFSRSETNKRVNTSLTCFKREFRDFLFLPESKQKLVQLDCSNSQPLMFTIMLKQHLKKHLPGDASAYISACESGRFYDQMNAKIQEIRPGYKHSLEADRSKFKVKCFSQIYYLERKKKANGVFQLAFKALYNSVWEVIDKIKEEKNGHKKLSLEMQSIESVLWIDKISKTFNTKYPQAFFATIHDSIIVEESYVADLNNIIIEAFNEYDLKPHVKAENFSKRQWVQDQKEIFETEVKETEKLKEEIFEVEETDDNNIIYIKYTQEEISSHYAKRKIHLSTNIIEQLFNKGIETENYIRYKDYEHLTQVTNLPETIFLSKIAIMQAKLNDNELIQEAYLNRTTCILPLSVLINLNKEAALSLMS